MAEEPKLSIGATLSSQFKRLDNYFIH